jgi:predicted enzyme related to lactoylglutathione lyase
MVYTSGDTTVNFYEESFGAITQTEFVKSNKHLGLTVDQLKEVHGMIKKSKPEEPQKQD